MKLPTISRLFQIAVLLVTLVLGGRVGWLMGLEFGGTLVALSFCIVGAVVTSALVGLLASFLGYRIE